MKFSRVCMLLVSVVGLFVFSLFLTGVISFSVYDETTGTLEEGSDAIERQDWSTAYRILLPLAEQDDSFAQYNVGVMYRDGLGTALDAEKAAFWFKKAADQGEANAQLNYGNALEFGRGVEQDYEEAMKYYRLGAGQGNAMAEHNIGSMFYNGHGVPQDHLKAAEWYAKAANRSLPIAQNALGAMYFNGTGVEKDINKGIDLIVDAANQGLPDARRNAFQIYYREAQAGNAGAQNNVAYMCLHKWSDEAEDPKDCIKFYELAAEQNYAASAKALAQIYTEGLFGLSADAAKAKFWTDRYAEISAQ